MKAAKDTIDIRIKLAASWAVLMFLYIYADILSLFRPGQLEEIMDGKMGPLEVTQGTLVMASVIVIIPALMVLASLMLKPAMNRWANMIAGGLFILVNIGNVIGEGWVYYLLFGVLEIAITVLITWFAWTWLAASTAKQ